MVRELASIKVKPSVKERLDREQERVRSVIGKKVSISELIEDLLNERADAPAVKSIEAELTSRQRDLLRSVAEMLRTKGGDDDVQRETADFAERAIRLWARLRGEAAR